MASGRIRDEDVTYVRDNSAIDDVVGDFVQLKSAGGGQKKGLCPFHDEKSPSFHNAKQGFLSLLWLWRRWGCNRISDED